LTASPLFVVAIIAFLLGSIPFGYLLVRIFRGGDIRKTGSGNIGATNVARTGSKGLAIATLLLDALKGYVAVVLAFRLTWPHRSIIAALPSGWNAWTDMPESMQRVYLAAGLAALCAILGHMFTPWLRFKGGKGVATAVGAFTAIAPRAVLVTLVFFVLIVAITRYVSLGSMLGAILFPFAAWWLNPFVRTPGTMALIATSSLLIIVRHKDNIRRLAAGNENRFGAEGKPA
jgi:glycerol-3-phosphate acyltransferase PlsY